MLYGKYEAVLDATWEVEMRIDDDMFDAADLAHDEDSQYSIIVLFQRECMKRYSKKPSRQFKWNDKHFHIERVGDAEPLRYRREPRQSKSK